MAGLDRWTSVLAAEASRFNSVEWQQRMKRSVLGIVYKFRKYVKEAA